MLVGKDGGGGSLNHESEPPRPVEHAADPPLQTSHASEVAVLPPSPTVPLSRPSGKVTLSPPPASGLMPACQASESIGDVVRPPLTLHRDVIRAHPASSLTVIRSRQATSQDVTLPANPADSLQPETRQPQPFGRKVSRPQRERTFPRRYCCMISMRLHSEMHICPRCGWRYRTRGSCHLHAVTKHGAAYVPGKSCLQPLPEDELQRQLGM